MEDTLKEIQILGARLSALKQEELKKKAELDNLLNEIKNLEEDVIPTLMDEAGVEEIKLANDMGKVKVYDYIRAHISKVNAPEAFQWLRETQNQSLIKNQIQIELERGYDQRAEQICADLDTRGVLYEKKESVHPSTLTSFVKEALNNPELAETMPKKALGVYEARRVKFS